jgi:hypothetical protein
MIGKTGFVVIAVISAGIGIGAHSINPRELYNEMYPVETLKRDTFHICHDADPTFVRAVKVDREACFDSMPNANEVALGRIHAGGALTMSALLDPAHQHELLQVVSTPPRQPVTAPQTFDNTQWARALSPACPGNEVHSPAAVALAEPGLPLPPGSGRADSLASTIPDNPPLLWHPATAFGPGRQAGDPGAAPPFAPLTSPDVGDKGPPAIVPVLPSANCGA